MCTIVLLQTVGGEGWLSILWDLMPYYVRLFSADVPDKAWNIMVSICIGPTSYKMTKLKP